jgi:hypothetical protein
MHLFKKKLLFLFFTLFYKNTISIEAATVLTLGAFAINQLYHIFNKIKKSDNINIDSKLEAQTINNINKYLEEDDTLLLSKKLNFCSNIVTEFSTWGPTLIIASPSLINAYSATETAEKVNKIMNAIMYGTLSTLFTLLIKSYKRDETKNTANKKLKNILNDDNSNENHSYKIESNKFRIPYIQLIIEPCSQNTILLDKLKPLYQKIKKIENNMKELKKNNFKNLVLDAKNDLKNTMEKIDRGDPFAYILSPEFEEKLLKIENLLNNCIEIKNNITININPYLTDVENESYINISEIKKQYEQFYKTVASTKLTDKHISKLAEDYNQLKNTIMEFKNIKTSPAYNNIIVVKKDIEEAKNNNLQTIVKESKEKLKKITSRNNLEYYGSADCCQEIESLKNELKSINDKKKELEEYTIAHLKKILQNSNINTSSLEKDISEYEKKITKIKYNEAENTLNSYKKIFNTQIEDYNNFINLSSTKEHADLYNTINIQYDSLKNKHTFENQLKRCLESEKLNITDSEITIENKIHNLRKTKKSTIHIIGILAKIFKEENTLDKNIQRYNELVSQPIFNNFPKEVNRHKKDYYKFNNEELIEYYNNLWPLSLLIEDNIEELYKIKSSLQEYFNNNKKIKEKIASIKSLTIYTSYIKNNEIYSKLEDEYRIYLATKIPFNSCYANITIQLYEKDIQEFISKSKKYLEIIDRRKKDYLEAEKYNNEFLAILENLKIDPAYSQGLNKFKENKKAIFNMEFLAYINEPKNNFIHIQKIKNIINETKNSCTSIGNTTKKINEMKSKIRSEKQYFQSLDSFNENEKNSIDKHYNEIENEINLDFNKYLSDFSITLNNKFNDHKYIDSANNLKSVIDNSKKNIKEIEKILQILHQEKKMIEEEEKKYTDIEKKYEILSVKKPYVETINAIEIEKNNLEKKRDSISEEIKKALNNYSHVPISNSSITEKIRNFEKKYFYDKLQRKKNICNKIDNKLNNILKNIPDEKKAEKNSDIENRENELKKCESISIESIIQISDNIENTLKELLKN